MLALLTSLLPLAPSQDALLERFAARVEEQRAELVELRRDLHENPELSGEERRTAGIVAARLSAAGFEVRTGVGGHGVVAQLVGARPGPVVAFRADMDAVLSDAPDPVEFRSLEPKKRHICGHDVHTTIGLALAEGFAAVRAELAGTLVLVFQPAEENGLGARAMLADGALREARATALFAWHCAPFEVGEFGASDGVLMAGRDRLAVTVSGAGAREEVARELVEGLRGLATLTPLEALAPAAIVDVHLESVSQRSASGELFVLAQISSGSRAVRDEVRAARDELVAALARDDVVLAPTWSARLLAGVENDPLRARAARVVLAREFGAERVHGLTTVVPAFSEDFGFFLDETPGAMFFLGVANAKLGRTGMPHAPDFVADEEAIFVGARAMAAVLLDALRSPPAPAATK
jgi:metal-dependent amidase/aminoacylase/carboxypeptidase family protein